MFPKPIPGRSSRQKKVDQIRLREALEGEDLKDAPAKPMPQGIKPMLATLIKEPFDHPDWIFEMKWDGYRAIAEIRDGDVSLYSRNGISFNRKFPPILDALRKFRFEAVLDGEIVVVDDRGHPDFQMLQDYQKSGSGHLLYYVFDLLYFAGHDLTGLPLVRRKELLKKILPSAPNIKFSDHVAKEGILFFQVVKEKGLEGIIAKHSQSAYRIGPEEPAMAEGEDAPHAGGGDRGLHGAAGEQKAFRRPGPGRLPGGRADLHRPYRRRLRGRDAQGNPRKTGSPDPEEVPLSGRAEDEYSRSPG